MSSQIPLLSLQKISAGYSPHQNIINNLSLDIFNGEIYVLKGSNGTGKSSLAKAILGFMPYCKGKTLFKGKDLTSYPSYQRAEMGIGYLMQGGQIFDSLTVRKHLDIVSNQLSKQDKKNDLEYLFSFFKDLLTNHLNTPATYLSGGLRQQLAISMLWLRKPQLLIFDEPMAGLSDRNRNLLIAFIDEWIKQKQLGVLLISHRQKIEFKEEFPILIFKNGRLYRK